MDQPWAPPPDTDMLTMRGIACLRRDRLLFEGVDLTLARGGAIVVTGPNGVGKTSLLRIAAGLLKPAAGTVRRDGGMAWLGEPAALDGEQPLRRALGFWARIDRRPAALDPAMAAMGIADLADVPARFLSTGQRRRAAIARVIARGADLWVLDEPINGLDPDGVGRLGRAIAAHRAGGGAVLAATHLPLPFEAREFVLAAPPA